MRERLGWHDARVQELAQRFGGDAFKARGDGFFIAFPTALGARDMAVTLQKALVQEFGDTFQIRTVLSTGEAQHREGDYFGLALSRAVRVLEFSHGTQLVLTETTARLIEEVEPAATAQLKDLGTHQLRSIEHPERLFQLMIPGLPTEFPPFTNASLPPHNLPRTLTTFIGREKECTAVGGLLLQTRLLTILGAGGSGKTRLSLKVGDELLMRYPGGVWFVDLAPVADEALFARAVAAALRVREDTGSDLMETLLSHLAPRKTLLILDNCEHLVGAAARFAQEVLVHCAYVTVLSTSREALGLTGEVAWPLPGLALPPENVTHPSRLMRYEAIQLFVERATAASPRFRLMTNNVACVARICRRLDGIPLALELVAACVSVLSLEQIEIRLKDRFGFPIPPNRTALPRQQTLRGALDWSHNLLTKEEQILWRRLSVFAGGFTLESLEAVCSDDLLQDYAVLEALFGLVRKSLIQRDSTADERYSILETVREYGLEKLKEANELPTFRLHHLQHFAALAEEAEPHLRGPNQKEWMERLEEEHPNLRAALTQPENGELALRLAKSILWFWLIREYLVEGHNRLTELLTAFPDALPQLRAHALRSRGALAMNLHRLSEAKVDMEQALALFVEEGNAAEVAVMQGNLGTLASDEHDYDKARLYLEQSLAYYRLHPNSKRLASILFNLGTVQMRAGQWAEAETTFAEGLVYSRELGDRLIEISTLHNLGVIAFNQQRSMEALNLLCQTLKQRIAIEGESGLGIIKNLIYLIFILYESDSRIDLLAFCIGKFEDIRRKQNTPLAVPEESRYTTIESIVKKQLDERFPELFSEGESATLLEVQERIQRFLLREKEL